VDNAWFYFIGSLASILGLLVYPTIAFLRFRGEVRQLSKDIRDIRDSIADPDHGPGAYLTRAAILSVLNQHGELASEAKELLEAKGCIATCPALPVLAKTLNDKLEQVKEDQEEFIKQSLDYRRETLESIRSIFDRYSEVSQTLEKVLNKFMSLVETAFTAGKSDK